MCVALARFLADPDSKPARKLIVAALLRRLCSGRARPIDFTFDEN